MSLGGSWHEQELLAALAAPIARGEIAIVHDLAPLTQGLAEAYPVRMNRIDWSALADVRELPAPPGRASSGFVLVEPAAELRRFWEGVRREHGIGDEASVIVLGDSLIGFALRLSAATLTEHLIEILSIPHHTYIFPDDLSWCFNYTAEDDAFFAKRPTPPGKVEVMPGCSGGRRR